MLVEQLGLRWDDFRRHLIAAIDDDPDRPYWDSWATALDAFVTEYLPNAANAANSGEKRAP